LGRRGDIVGNGGTGGQAGNGGNAGIGSPLSIFGTFTPGQQLLVTTPPPASVHVHTPFGLVVKVENGSGQVDTSFNGTVTITLASNPGKDHLSGLVKVKAVSGVATFSGLELHKMANGYRLKVSATGAVSTLTEFIDVIP